MFGGIERHLCRFELLHLDLFLVEDKAERRKRLSNNCRRTLARRVEIDDQLAVIADDHLDSAADGRFQLEIKSPMVAPTVVDGRNN